MLKGRTRERVPFDWAAAQHNLGNVLMQLGEEKEDITLLKKAADAYRAALEVFESPGSEHYREIARENLEEALELIREMEMG